MENVGSTAIHVIAGLLPGSASWSLLRDWIVADSRRIRHKLCTPLIEHVTPVLENIRLVDRLASEAAEYERQRIARDIHDGMIQPYIGLQLGLAAIRQKIERGNNDVGHDVRELTCDDRDRN